MGLLLVLIALLITAPAKAQEITIQTAAPSQELLWKANSLENQTKFQPKDKQDWNAVAAAYKAAADLGHPDAMADFARIIAYLGRSEEAEIWYKKSADEGSTVGQYAYGTVLYLKDKKNCPKTIELYKRAAENGNLDGIAALSWFYKDGICGVVPRSEAEKYLKIGSERGSSVALNNYAKFLLDHNFLSKNDIQAMVYFFIASENTSVSPRMNLDVKAAKENAKHLIQRLKAANKMPKAYAFLRQTCSKTSACQFAPWQLVKKINSGEFEKESGFDALFK